MEYRPCIINLENVSLVREGKNILCDINLSVGKGEFIAITGPNGGGKTSLLKLMLGLLKPTKGKIEYFNPGHNIQGLDAGYLPQKNAIDNHFPVTVEEVVAFGLLGTKIKGKTEKVAKVNEALRLVGMESERRRPIGKLSGGQLQRALLARAIVREPSVLFLDEPLSYLDKQFEPQLYELLENLSCRGVTIILVSHEMSRISAIATRHLLVNRTLHTCNAPVHYIPSNCV